MGIKYEILCKESGLCPIWTSFCQTRIFIVAMLYMVIARFKYPIVDVNIRNGYIDCEKCNDIHCPEKYKEVLNGKSN